MHCRSLEREESGHDRSYLSELYGPIESIAAVPFSHGVLTITTHGTRFSARDLLFLDELADCLSYSFRRVEDLKELTLSDVAKLGSRLLEEQKSGVEAADAIRLRFAGEQAVMRSMAGAFGEGLNLTMRIMARWIGAAEDGINISVNRDFVDVALSPAQIQSYMGLHQAGHISYATLYDLLASGELTRNGVDWTEEREQIDSEQESDLASARALTQLVSGATEEDNSFGR